MEISNKWKNIKAYGICMPDGIMLGEIKKTSKEIEIQKGLFKKVKLSITVTKIY